MNKPKLLCLCDSPTMDTGFGRVSQNLISRWAASGLFADIWVWGIGYSGFPHALKHLENRICPATNDRFPLWHQEDNLRRFLMSVENTDVGGTPGGFSHVWILQDLFLLSPMANAFKEICRSRHIQTFCYFPVDAAMDPEWTNFIEAVDVPVAYTEQGRQEAIKALQTAVGDRRLDKARHLKAQEVQVLPHGADTTVYFPRTAKDPDCKEKFRQQMFSGSVGSKDFLMLNVAQHQKRKGLAQSLMLLKRIQEIRPEMNAKLYIHAQSINNNEGTNLKQVAQQLGLRRGKDIFFGDSFFKLNRVTIEESVLNSIYNAADLLISTSYGEGWGLPLTEAMAAGIPVAGPNHSSIAELLGEGRGILFNTLGADVIVGDNSRVRPRTDIDDAAMKIVHAWMAERHEGGSLKSYAQRGHDWIKGDAFKWDNIAAQWIRYFFPKTS